MAQVVVQVVEGANKEPLKEEEDLIFLINMLDQTDREEFAEAFADDLETMLSKSGLWRILNGKIHLSNEKIMRVVEVNDDAKRWIARRIKEKMKRASKIIGKMEMEE